jgi:Xaa-Pro aminopeptidase
VLARPDRHPDPIDAHAAARRLIEAFEEVLDLRHHLLIPHGLGRPVDVHHHGPLEVGAGAVYRVQTLERLTSPGSGGSSAPVPN